MATALSATLNQPLSPCVRLRGNRHNVAKAFSKRPTQKPLSRSRPQKAMATIGIDINEVVDPAMMEKGIVGSIAASAVGFVATFFVAPSFKGELKEEFTWKEMVTALREDDLQSLTPKEAQAMQKKGALIVDVRAASTYGQGFIEGSLNAPLYRAIQGWGLAANVRRTAFAFFGIYGSEFDTEWLPAVEAEVPKDKKLIVLCERGGRIDTDTGTKFGFESRSLKAAFRLKNAGYKNVSHLKGGISQWERDGLPLREYAGEDDK